MPKRGEQKPRDELPLESRVALRERVAAYKRERDLTNRDMAARLGVDIATLSKIANLGGVGIRTLLKLRDSMEVPLDALLGLRPLGPKAELKMLLETAIGQLADDDELGRAPQKPTGNRIEDATPERVVGGKKHRGRQDPAQG